ncbi:MAG: sodium:solute symporter [Flavobacteriales bacterium]|nr:sodium:solute symporter [Flavobacteriales bacterium]
MVSPIFIIFILFFYFLVLIIISNKTSKSQSNYTFFVGEKKSPWYIVAYGMIGVSLSGITFLSVPGWVKFKEFYYMQMVLGYVPGYFFVAYILMPIYYKMNLYSIYEYLLSRFGYYSHKSGSVFFFLSRLLGASLRLYLVAEVLQLILFDQLNVSFFVTTAITIILIWIYTYRGGIKTIIWTDTLQTTFMLLTLLFCIYFLFDALNYSSIKNSINENILDLRFFDFSNFKDTNHFIRSFFSGMFIAIAMTGLDQDMMQKNLSCINIKDAQKNMVWFSIILVFVNMLFLYLGSLLYQYAYLNDINASGDVLFVEVIRSGKLGSFIFILFLLGLMSAAYSSADSALTSLTTSFCVDFLNMSKDNLSSSNIKRRSLIHLLVSILLFLIIILVKNLNNDSIISTLFLLASYTYGPLLGLFMFGLFSKRKVFDHYVPFIVILSPLLSYFISLYDIHFLQGFDFGPDLIIINWLITILLLFIFSKK